MIAQPNSSTTAPVPASTSATQSFVDHSPLLAAELYRLTLYKWRYSLEAFGFEGDEVRGLMFIKWLHASHRILP